MQDGVVDLEEYIGDMYRPSDYPELNGKEPDWVQSEREMFKEHRDKNADGKLDKVWKMVQRGRGEGNISLGTSC